MVCNFCTSSDKYKEFHIKQYKYWRVELYNYQYYLGRCIVVLNRHTEDFFDINNEEAKELFTITKHLRDVLRKTFGADMLNYATLGNIIRHVHLHVIPRYTKPVEFAGVTFTDERWGQNYAPYNKDFQISSEIMHAIVNKIKENI